MCIIKAVVPQVNFILFFHSLILQYVKINCCENIKDTTKNESALQNLRIFLLNQHVDNTSSLYQHIHVNLFLFEILIVSLMFFRMGL